MNIITVSREYGAGGGEVASRLAEALGWELLDHKLLHEAAAVEQLPDAEIERLDEKAINLAERFQPHPAHQKYIHGIKEAAQQAAARGNVILVGRGTSHLLGDIPNAFHLRLVAPREWRVERMARLQRWSTEDALARFLDVDRTRQRFTGYFFGAESLRPDRHDFVVNTGRVPLDDVVACMMAVVHDQWPAPAAPATGQRVLTLARELGAGDTGFALTLAARLGLKVSDRVLLEQEALRQGLTEANLDKIYEQPAGIVERFQPGSFQQRYFEVLSQLMSELAAKGDVLLVGRGASRFLREQRGAFHVRLVAPLAVRIRRVMEHRWLRQDAAEQLIAESDAQRGQLYRDYFGADRSDPLEYHVTVNTGRLGPLAVDLLALAANRYWERLR